MSPPLNRDSFDRISLDALPKAVRALVVLCRECRAHTEAGDTFRAASEQLLSRLGVTRDTFEWLLNANCIVRAAPDQFCDAAHRSVVRHSEHRESYFVVTRTGTEFLKEILDAVGVNNEKVYGNGSQRSELPTWDGRQLQFCGIVLKRFRRPSPNQELLLDAFEQRGWPKCIDNPLPQVPAISPIDRLHDSVKRLNRSLDIPLIHFGGNGIGTGVCWRVAPPPSAGRILKKIRERPRAPLARAENTTTIY